MNKSLTFSQAKGTTITEHTRPIHLIHLSQDIQNIKEQNKQQPVKQDSLLELLNENQSKFFTVNLTNKNLTILESSMLLTYQTKNIQVLDLSDNQISEFPLCLNLLNKLSILRINNNLLKILPEAFINQTKLVKLSVANNLLTKIPDNLKVLANLLEYLDISRNHIYILIEDLFELKKIQILKINCNCFTSIPFYILKIQKTLTELWIDWIEFINTSISSKLCDQQLKFFFTTVRYLNLEKKLNFDMFDLLKSKEFVNFILKDFSSNQRGQSIQALIPNISQFPNDNIIETDLSQKFKLSDKIPSKNELSSNKSHSSNNSINQESYPSKKITLDPVLINFPESDCEAFYFDYVDFSGRNLMHIAIENENIGVLRQLINKHKQLINQLDNDGHTPLSLAIKEERYLCAKFLLQANANCSIGGSCFGSPLNIAILKMQNYLVKDLIQKGCTADCQDDKGNNPFHYLFSIFEKDFDECSRIANILLSISKQSNQSDCNPNLYNNSGYTPLNIVFKRGSYQTALFALKTNYQYQDSQIQKLNKTYYTFPFDFTKKSQFQEYSNLHLSILQGNLSCFKLLCNLEFTDINDTTLTGEKIINMVQGDLAMSKIFYYKEKKSFKKLFIPRKIDQQQLLHKSSNYSYLKSFDGEDSPAINSQNLMVIKSMNPKCQSNMTIPCKSARGSDEKQNFEAAIERMQGLQMPKQNFFFPNNIQMLEQKSVVPIKQKNFDEFHNSSKIQFLKYFSIELNQALKFHKHKNFIKQKNTENDVQNDPNQKIQKLISLKYILFLMNQLLIITNSDIQLATIFQNIFTNFLKESSTGFDFNHQIIKIIEETDQVLQQQIDKCNIPNFKCLNNTKFNNPFILQLITQYFLKNMNLLKQKYQTNFTSNLCHTENFLFLISDFEFLEN